MEKDDKTPVVSDLCYTPMDADVLISANAAYPAYAISPAETETSGAERNLHKDHRKRMKERFLTDGLDSFAKHEVLEFLLYYAIPQGDTNHLAHRLLDKFEGSLYEVFTAPISELKSVKGISDHSAILLKMIPQLMAAYEKDIMDREGIRGSAALARYAYTRLRGEKVEKVLLLCLNNRYELIKGEIISEGTVEASLMNRRRIVEACICHNATAVILAHNHPRGFSSPSAEDIASTQRIRAALDTIEVKLMDHIIVAPDGYRSMKEIGKYSGLFSC